MLDLVALAWMASSIAGTAGAGYGIIEGGRDLRALGHAGNGRRTIARGYIRSQAVRLGICLAWGALGVPALTDGIQTPLNPFTAILVATNIALTAAALLDLRDRRRLQKGA